MSCERQEAVLWEDDAAFLCIKAPYSEAFNRELRNKIPGDMLAFSRADKVWRINPAYKDVARGIATSNFAEFPANLREAYRALWLVEGAPIEVVQASYRELVSMYKSSEDEAAVQRVALAFRTIKASCNLPLRSLYD